jgi:phage baseplate assembly protein W
METAAVNMFTRQHECGATVDLDHIRQRIECVWEEDPGGKKVYIQYGCLCGSSLVIPYDEIPEEIRREADRVEELRRNTWPTMKAQ